MYRMSLINIIIATVEWYGYEYGIAHSTPSLFLTPYEYPSAVLILWSSTVANLSIRSHYVVRVHLRRFVKDPGEEDLDGIKLSTLTLIYL
jgi:hypothetical protein